MTSSPPRRAFSLIELLMVVAIIAILASLILAGTSMLSRQTKTRKTEVIIAALRQAMELTIANRGGCPSPVEHPLAGSRQTMALFGGALWVRDGATGTTVQGTTGTGAGQYALTGADPVNFDPPGNPGDAARLMLRTDVYARPEMPMLFGLTRDRIGVLGSMQKAVSKFIQLPKLPKEKKILNVNFVDTNWFTPLLVPTDYQDQDLTVMGQPSPDPFGTEKGNKLLLDYLFGNSNAQAELAGLKALIIAGPGSPTWNVGLFEITVNGKLIPRVYTNGSGAQSEWSPGTVKDVNGWRPYKLPGLALYDAWGQEILYSLNRAGSLRLLSAGADGAFRFAPGDDHTLETNDPNASSHATGDRDGTRDNVVDEVQEIQ